MRHTSLYSPEPAKGWLPWGAIAPFLCILLVALPNVGVFYLLKPFGFVDAKGDPIGVVGFCAYMLETFIAMSLVVLGWVRFVERRPIATIGLTGAHPMRTLLHGYAIGIATVSFVVAMIGITGGYHVSGILNAFHSPKALLGIVALLPCFIVQSSVEELIFRGWLLSTVARKIQRDAGRRAHDRSVHPAPLQPRPALGGHREPRAVLDFHLPVGAPLRQHLGRHGLARRMELADGSGLRDPHHRNEHRPAGADREAGSPRKRSADRRRAGA